jgi:hypothetical protein
MSAKNNITGDSLITKSTNDAYRDGWERIFGKKKSENQNPNQPEKHTGSDTKSRKKEPKK